MPGEYGDYIIPFGDFAGQKLNEIGHIELDNYLKRLERASKAMSFNRQVAEAMTSIAIYLKRTNQRKLTCMASIWEESNEYVLHKQYIEQCNGELEYTRTLNVYKCKKCGAEMTPEYAEKHKGAGAKARTKSS
jgi:hypothetical protein